MDKVKFNLKNVHMAPIKEILGQQSWDKPIRVPGAVTLTLEPSGDVAPFYADGITYYNSVANNGYTGDLEMALFPAEILKTIYKMEEGNESKVITENAFKEPVPFALLFEEDGDSSGTKFVLYNTSATRPSRSFSTNTESKNVQTQKISITAAPLENGRVMAMTQSDTPKEIIDGWYKNVFEESETE